MSGSVAYLREDDMPAVTLVDVFEMEENLNLFEKALALNRWKTNNK